MIIDAMCCVYPLRVISVPRSDWSSVTYSRWSRNTENQKKSAKKHRSRYEDRYVPTKWKEGIANYARVSRSFSFIPLLDFFLYFSVSEICGLGLLQRLGWRNSFHFFFVNFGGLAFMEQLNNSRWSSEEIWSIIEIQNTNPVRWRRPP